MGTRDGSIVQLTELQVYRDSLLVPLVGFELHSRSVEVVHCFDKLLLGLERFLELERLSTDSAFAAVVVAVAVAVGVVAFALPAVVVRREIQAQHTTPCLLSVESVLSQFQAPVQSCRG